MTEIRQKVVPVEKSLSIQPEPNKVELSENINGDTLKDSGSEIKELQAWESENKKKFSIDYFNAKELSAEFNTKMLISKVDKFIKEELKDKKYAETTDNYKKLLEEIENYLGSSNMELYTRLNKITAYINIINKEKALKKLKETYAHKLSSE